MTTNPSQAKMKLADHSSIPEWARDLLRRKDVPANNLVGVSCETKQLSISYLEFLREQIALAARGPEWTQILSDRLRAYEGVVDVDLVLVEVWDERARIFGYLRASDLEVIYVESAR